jgi:metal-sulfur cluster biosynthetic enzyme
MQNNGPVTLTRDVDAAIVPVGDKVTLQKGEEAHISQSLGGSYTIIVNGTQENLEKEIWNQLRTCYDPEIPVNIVDLGLIYDCHITPLGANSHKAEIKMTLTAPGCGMGPMLAQDVQNKLLSLEGVDDVAVELVWDPPWNQGMLTEAAKLQLGLM